MVGAPNTATATAIVQSAPIFGVLKRFDLVVLSCATPLSPAQHHLLSNDVGRRRRKRRPPQFLHASTSYVLKKRMS